MKTPLPSCSGAMSERAAYHEAGHALAARALGLTVDSVSLGPFDGGGVTQLRQRLAADSTLDEIERALTVLFAGEAAERYARR